VHIYLHVPFCARRCSYCDFAIAVRREVPSEAYTGAVLSEWQGWQRHPVWQRSPGIATIYFGGGTPSRLAPGGVARIIEGIAAARPLAPGAEITLEANPEDVTLERAAAWRAAGVNRISLGVQSLDPAVLRWMHRTHSVAQVQSAVEAVRAAGIHDLSLDLIFGLPAALGRDWAADLEGAFALRPEHLSLYGLTVEDHTPLARWATRGEVTPVDDERYAAEFLAAAGELAARGYEHYEVSNASRPGHRARHNSAYWRRAPYLGLGPSAHSGWESERQWNIRDWAAYERAVAGESSVVAGRESLEEADVALEELYLGLRTREGLPAGRIPPGIRASWVRSGWAADSGEKILLTPEGWLRLDALVASVA